MIKPNKLSFQLILGSLVSGVCIWLALRSVDFGQMRQAFQTADYKWLIPSGLVIFLSHFLRAFRWRYLLDPIKRMNTGNLFSALMIGYAANTFMPAHLGEFLRAYVLSKKQHVEMSRVFATIVVERVIDIISLLALLLLTLFVYPFPDWVIRSGYVMAAGTTGLILFLIFLKKATAPALTFVSVMLKPFPRTIRNKTETVLEHFVGGLLPLNRWHDYIMVILLSVAIWGAYALVFHFALHAFDFTSVYQLQWSASLIILIITTIAVIVPSSPGYIGIYHYLCQVSLSLFGIPAGPALSFATAAHAVSMLPVFIAGLICAHVEGMAIFKMSAQTARMKDTTVSSS